MGSRVGSHPDPVLKSHLGSLSASLPGFQLFFLRGVRYGGAGLSTYLKYITLSLLASTGTHYYE